MSNLNILVVIVNKQNSKHFVAICCIPMKTYHLQEDSPMEVGMTEIQAAEAEMQAKVGYCIKGFAKR